MSNALNIEADRNNLPTNCVRVHCDGWVKTFSLASDWQPAVRTWLKSIGAAGCSVELVTMHNDNGCLRTVASTTSRHMTLPAGY